MPVNELTHEITKTDLFTILFVYTAMLSVSMLYIAVCFISEDKKQNENE